MNCWFGKNLVLVGWLLVLKWLDGDGTRLAFLMDVPPTNYECVMSILYITFNKI